MRKIYLTILMLLIIAVNVDAQKTKTVVLNDTLTALATLLYNDDFDGDLSNWQAQLENPGGTVVVNNEKLEITAGRGCTVWFTKNLTGPIMIEYDAVMLDKGGELDRVSDLNCFFMASDPADKSSLFVNSDELNGGLGDYNKLKLYYVGQGGRNNSTTRFRRYAGDGERPMLPEHDLRSTEYLLKGNVVNHVKIIVYDGVVQYHRNDHLIFSFFDTKPHTSGYFGFRTTINHMTADDFKVYSLDRVEGQ